MNVELAIAALGCLVLALGHTTIGLRWVLPNLTKGGLPRTPVWLALDDARHGALHLARPQRPARGLRHPPHGARLGSGRRSQDPAAALGCRPMACCDGAGLLERAPPSLQPPASSGAVGLRGDRGAVLDSIDVSLDPFVIRPRTKANFPPALGGSTRSPQIPARPLMAGKVPTYSGNHLAGCAGGRSTTRPTAAAPSTTAARRPQHHGSPPTQAGHSRRRQAMPGHPSQRRHPAWSRSPAGCQPRQHQAVDGDVAGRGERGRSRLRGQGRLEPYEVQGGGAGSADGCRSRASAG